MLPLLFVVLSGSVPLEAPVELAWGSVDGPVPVAAARGAEVEWSSRGGTNRTALLRRASRTVRLQLRSRSRRTVRRAEYRSQRAVDTDASLRVQQGAAVARKVARRTTRARIPQRIAPADPHPPAA